MTYPNIFTREVSDQMIKRINDLTAKSPSQWGKMSVDQMLAHCNVAYELIYTDKHPRPNAIARFFIKIFAKNTVVGPKPYAKNLRTAPIFLMTDKKVFEDEKKRLIDYINKTQELGESHFTNKENPSFGVLTLDEWNNLFYKHLDHHLQQFGV